MNFDDMIDVDQECVVTDEMIRLLHDTTSANHFNFIAPNVGPGDHTIEVKANVSAAASAGDGAAKGQAVVNIGSLSVEVVRSANTTDGITVEWSSEERSWGTPLRRDSSMCLPNSFLADLTL